MSRRILMLLVPMVVATSLAALATRAADGEGEPLFQRSSECIVCHNGLLLPDGRDVSLGTSWSSSMMANASRDPYWHAGVRREVMDHPAAASVIEGECSRCHMPMSHHLELQAGTAPQVLGHLPDDPGAPFRSAYAADGVSCTVCHQVEAENLGTDESFTGHFVVAPAGPEVRTAYGPFAPDAGLTRIMESAVGHRQQDSEHIQRSELCATCHTLFTHAVGYEDYHGPPLPEQVPYLEWRHSDYVDDMSCQDCHMPTVPGKTPVASVLGREHADVSQHVFRGGNFVLPQLFRRHREELAVAASQPALERTEEQTREHLRTSAADLSIALVANERDTLEVAVSVANLAGHKVPTAYPSRRAWLHFRATDFADTVLLESGALLADGSIQGNDNDADATRYEPHHLVVDSPEKVQIYEDIMGTPDGRVTTGLLRATQYLKDNRLLPEGFDKTSAPPPVAVHGNALTDEDFGAGGDTVLYRVKRPVGCSDIRLTVRLLYQPIGFRWAHNLGSYQAAEPQRFVRYFGDIGATSAEVLATEQAILPAPEDPPEEPLP